MNHREHLTTEGLQKIVSIKAVLNKGLLDKLKVSFPNIVPAIRPQVTSQRIIDPYWVSGFASAEGCFLLVTKNSSKGGSVGFRFLITQHIRDAELLKSLVNYLGCGKYYLRAHRPMYGDYLVTRLNDIKDKIIPFFDNYPIKGVKSCDFQDFKQVMLLKENLNPHLTKEELAKIKQIKSGMNKGRIGGQAIYEIGLKKTLSCSSSITRPSNQEVTLSVVNNKRHYSTTPIINLNPFQSFEWLAGLIDGDGQFQITKKSFASLTIVMNLKDKSSLYLIKHKYGGFVKEIAGSNALKYKLNNPKGLISLIKDVNGLIRNPTRLLQLNKICLNYKIKLQEPQPLTYSNGWFSGLVDSDGSIHIDEKSGQLIISVTQKNKYLLEPLQKLYGGRIKISKSKEAFQYSIYRKEEILKLVDIYFKNFPLKSSKASKVNLIRKFYLLSEHINLNVNKLDKFNQWVMFKDKWDKL